MFCADYIAAFIHHGLINIGLLECRKIHVLESTAMAPFVAGGIAGFLGACSVFPFDFVRRGVIIHTKPKFIHSLSTVPYAFVFFGLYFCQRNPDSLKSQCSWAFLSAAGAAAAEVPFDKAKFAMMSSKRTMFLVSALYVPFGALMLVLYDKALINYRKKLG